VISISKYDLGADIRHQLLLRHGFYAARCPYRHKDGRKDLPVVGADLSRPRARFQSLQLKF